MEAVFGIAVAALGQVCHGRVGSHGAERVAAERGGAEKEGRQVCPAPGHAHVVRTVAKRRSSSTVEMSAALFKLLPVFLLLFVAKKKLSDYFILDYL